MNKSIIKSAVVYVGIVCLFVLICIACAKEESNLTKIKDLEFTVLGNEEIPKELLETIEERKETAFKFTYSDGEYLYIAVGYGQQVSGGYHIQANQLYLTKNAIYCETTLIGPSEADIKKLPSFPYIVLKTEDRNMRVVFESP